METISVRQANQNFSRYLALVDQGQEFVIAKRGRPIAKLSSLTELAQAETVANIKQWLDGLDFKGVNGPFTEQDKYD